EQERDQIRYRANFLDVRFPRPEVKRGDLSAVLLKHLLRRRQLNLQQVPRVMSVQVRAITQVEQLVAGTLGGHIHPPPSTAGGAHSNALSLLVSSDREKTSLPASAWVYSRRRPATASHSPVIEGR